ncbi:MAG: hypothetical protein GC205_11950 [Bacteroidetes bacterium]|nr:hypothetical protein [Bacteroidota bacterium]
MNKHNLFAGWMALLAASPGFAQIKVGTYASVNSFEKVCLRLDQNERFAFFSSNCTTDRDFSGRWQLREDTLVLNSNHGPFMELGLVRETEANASMESTPGEALATDQSNEQSSTNTTKLTLRSADAPLLRSIRVSTGDTVARPNSYGVIYLGHESKNITFSMDGMPSLQYAPVDPKASAIDVEIQFKNLDKPSLFNDRWLLSGRTLTYLPGPGSSRSAEIALVRGKRCFYKLPK